VLAVYDWPKQTDRYQRMQRLVDYLFVRFEKLQKEPGYHEKWKDVNLAATVPGWTRFKPLQERLDKELRGAGGDETARRNVEAARANPDAGADRTRSKPRARQR
ncbi:MAG TPA: hypothetical protein VFA64_12865, partial [Hyphomicrobiaceae bacterium]|nr:hypothetical protein [Hyphomicrobiaceae bacterium]